MADNRKVLVTGTAGFIGFHTAKALLERGYEVTGLDNINDYYDVRLKHDRLQELKGSKHAGAFTFHKLDLVDASQVQRLFDDQKFDVVVHLAAQAGVRYSLENPGAYIKSNIEGFTSILEGCRHSGVKHLIYASSSSVYGLNGKLPFSEADRVDHPISLYAATKKSNELMAHTYAHLFRLPTTGLRFFTVYGPWGRPDMAMFIFAKAILEGRPITLFNGGDMLRDFTYVDDVVESIVRLCEKPATPDSQWNACDMAPDTSSSPYRIFNIGNHDPIVVKDLIGLMEKRLGKQATVLSQPIQPGDVRATFADTERLMKHVDFQPKTSIESGLHRFLDWLLAYRQRYGQAQAH